MSHHFMNTKLGIFLDSFFYFLLLSWTSQSNTKITHDKSFYLTYWKYIFCWLQFFLLLLHGICLNYSFFYVLFLLQSLQCDMKYNQPCVFMVCDVAFITDITSHIVWLQQSALATSPKCKHGCCFLFVNAYTI